MDAGRDPTQRTKTPTDCLARRLTKEESGWTLIELLVVAAVLVVVLTAVLSIADSTQRTASSDQQRTNAIGDAQTGIARIADNLRNACAVFGPGGTITGGYICRTVFNAPPGASACTRSSDCVDFIMSTRTAVARPVGTPTRALQRVRIDCGQTDPAPGTQTQCARYAASCTPAACPSPTTLTGVVVRSVANAGATGSPSNVFVYCTRDTISSATGGPTCGATPGAAGSIQISLAVNRRGQNRSGGPGAFYLQDAAELKNINQDAS
jgi:type II secretory pathway pseudopilin PulG